MTQKKKKTSGRRRAMVVAVLIAIFLLSVLAGVSAKYAQTTTKKENTVSPDFYFTSTMLSEKGKQYTLKPNTTELTIPVCNYADDLRFSARNIKYSYTVTKDNLSKKISSVENQSIQGGKANAGNISLTGLSAGTYKVTVTAQSPFTTTLTGTFVIPEEASDIHYSVSDSSGSPCVLLTVWADNYSGEVQLKWPAGVIPDSTDSQLQEVKTYTDGNTYGAGTATVNVSPYSSGVYRFFKADPSQVYSDQQLTAAKTNQ